jgi:photosystem II stability/assembly factor-like uncharacterized protein
LTVVEVASPDPKFRWRLAGPTAIDRSIDGGVTWTRQTIGVPALAFASQDAPAAAMRWTTGSSPAPEVCWVVGGGGIVLLSTDGRTWQMRRLPEAVDLIAVHAVDARTATVTTADGRQFSTSDAGLSWSQVRGRPPAERD